MNANAKNPEVWFLSLVSLLIILVFYPMTIAPAGPLANGGILGFGSLVVATICSWTAFIRSRSVPLFHWLLHLPIAVAATWIAVWDGLAQYHLAG